MTDRAALEALMNGPIQRTCWMADEPCPRCDGMTLATNGSGAAWCVDRACGYARQVKRGTPPMTRRPSPEALREAGAMVVKYAGAARQRNRATAAQKRRK